MKVELIDRMGSDLTVVNAARVSMDKHHTKFTAGDERLIRYLARHEHWTPFAHPQVQFRIEAPVFVANQLKRHQIGFALNEVSRRYVDSEPAFEAIAWRYRPDGSIKQGSGGPVPCEVQGAWEGIRLDAQNAAVAAYRRLLKRGAAPELARSVLPQSMHTSWYWTGSLYAWARLCRQRTHPHAQYETGWIARAIRHRIGPLFPVSWRALTSTPEQLDGEERWDFPGHTWVLTDDWGLVLMKTPETDSA